MGEQVPKNLKVNPELHHRIRVHVAQVREGLQEFTERVMERALSEGGDLPVAIYSGLSPSKRKLLETIADLMRDPDTDPRFERALTAIVALAKRN